MTLLNQNDAPWQADQMLYIAPDSFELIQERFLAPLGKSITRIERERESAEYGADRFDLDGQTCLYRHAKDTPKKIGQFVTLWKRPMSFSEIAPFDIDDGIDHVIIFADGCGRFGVFVFQAKLLAKKDIFSEHSKGGRRAFRVYAPWTEPAAVQARQSKTWQCSYFVELTHFQQGMAQLSQII